MLADLFNQLTNLLIPAIEQFRVGGYWVAFFAAFLETLLGVGLILPGSTLLLLLGALAAKGYLSVEYVIFFAILGATLGDNLNYFLGKHFGDRWLKKDYWFLKAQHLDKSREFLNKHGAKSVFLGRFVPTVKEIMPFIAGSVHMNHGKFMLWNVLGAIGWGCQFVLPGYLFAQSLSLAQLWLSRIGLFILLIILIIVLFYWLKRILIRRGPALVAVIVSLGQSIKHAILNNKHVQHWQQSHPASTSFIKARLNPEHFTGLPLSVLGFSLLYVLGLFGGLVEDLISSDMIVFVDVRLANLLTAYRSDELVTLFTWITRLGNTPVIVTFCLSAVVLFWLSRQKPMILPLLMSVLGSTAFTFLGKVAFQRPRPDTAIFLEHSASFPSGHATIAVAFYGFIGWAIAREMKTVSSKLNVLLVTIGIIAAIGFSRLYLGEHYLSDVWAGYLVGIMWLIFAVILMKWRDSVAKHSEEKRLSDAIEIPNLRQFKGAVLTASLLVYIGFSYFYAQAKVPYVSPTTAVVPKLMDVINKDGLHYTLTVLGTEQEPINLIFTAPSTSVLYSNLKAAGWNHIEDSSKASLTKQFSQLLAGQGRGALPLSPSFWQNRVQDSSWVLDQPEASYAHSLHLKVWQTNKTLPRGDVIFVGMTNAVSDLSWKLFPKIEANLDHARAKTTSTLQSSAYSPIACKSNVHPISGHNFVGDPFYTDGKACIIQFTH